MTTPVLDLTEISAGLSDKETPANTAWRALEATLCTLLAVTGDADREIDETTPTPAEHRYLGVVWSGALTADRYLVVGDTPKLWLVKNNTTGGFSITVRTAAGLGITLGPGQEALLRCDGTDVVRAGANTAEQIVRVGFFFFGDQNADEARVLFRDTVVFPASLSGSGTNQQANPTADSTYTLYKRSGGVNTAIGTIVFVGGGSTVNITFASAVTFNAGDVLIVAGPATADATHRKICITLAGTRS
jgi:hypothetical protein